MYDIATFVKRYTLYVGEYFNQDLWMDDMRYDDIVVSQAKIREKLLQVIIDNQLKTQTLAREIGITRQTLINFIKQRRKTNFASLCKIIGWLNG